MVRWQPNCLAKAQIVILADSSEVTAINKSASLTLASLITLNEQAFPFRVLISGDFQHKLGVAYRCQ